MKISIIVPVYNSEQTLSRCVSSLLQQKCEELEILLVDDHSTDASLALCRKLAETSDKISVLESIGRGVSAARNTGLQHAGGEIIGFCDADDIYVSDALETVENIFRNDARIDMVISGYYYSSCQESVIVDETKHYPKECSVTSQELLELVLTDDRIMGSVWNKFYRNSIVNGVTFDTALSHCEDTQFNVKVLTRNPRGYIITKPLYHYIRNENSATRLLERIFDEQGNLKYITAMKSVVPIVIDNERACTAVGYRITTLALDTLYHHDLPDAYRKRLQAEIKNHWKDFLAGVGRYVGQGSLKWFVKWMIVKLRGVI